MKSEKPTYVPLPDLDQHTDHVRFESLGLPLGFDEDRLHVNVKGFERVCAIAGLERVSFNQAKVDDETLPDVSGVDASGTATAAAISFNSQKPLVAGSVVFPTSSSQYDNAEAFLTINRDRFESLVVKKTPDTEHVIIRDPKPWAKALNAAVRHGLSTASRQANFDMQKLKSSTYAYGLFFGLGVSTTASLADALESLVRVSPLLPAMANLAVVQQCILMDKPFSKEVWARYRQSYFVGCAPDRYLGAAAVIRATKFVKAV